LFIGVGGSAGRVIVDSDNSVMLCCVISTRRSTAHDEVPPGITVHPSKEVPYKTNDRVLLECEATGSPQPQ